MSDEYPIWKKMELTDTFTKGSFTRTYKSLRKLIDDLELDDLRDLPLYLKYHILISCIRGLKEFRSLDKTRSIHIKIEDDKR